MAYGIEEDDIRSAPDTALLEAVGIAYRLRQTAVVENIMVDLLRRLGVTVTVTHVRPVEELTTSAVTVTPEPIEPIPDLEKTSDLNPVSVTVTRRGYPIEAQQMAVGMADEGKSSREIVAAIEELVGRAPAVSNLQKLIKGWRAAL